METLQQYIARQGASNVQRLLAENGLTVSRQTVWYWEKGMAIPSPENAYAIIDYTEIQSLDQIYPRDLCAYEIAG